MPYGSSLRVCKIGNAKAKVLPEPVLAQPTQSSPFKIAGIQFSWISVGFLKPRKKMETLMLN